MLDSHHAKFCDICANRGPCHFCGSRGTDAPIKLMKSMLHEPCELIKVFMDNSGKVISEPMEKSAIKNHGMDDVPIVSVYEKDVVFGIPDMPIKDLFKTNYTQYYSTITDANQLGMVKIYIGVFK